LLLENEAGALARTVGLFAQRGYNVDSLAVAPVDDGSVSRVTIMTAGDDRRIEQIIKQLNKLIEVIKIVDITEDSHIERELLLVKVRIHNNRQKDLQRLIASAGGSIVDSNQDIYTLEITGEPLAIDSLLEALPGIAQLMEMVRSGVLGITKGSKILAL